MSTSPRRVPPDQSGIAEPLAASALSGSRSRISRVTRVSRVPMVNTSVEAGRARTAACAKRSRASAYGRHRAGDVDEQDDAPRARLPAAVQQPGHLAAVAQRPPHRAGRVHRAPRAGPPAPGRAHRGRRAQQGEQPAQVVALGDGSCRRRPGAAAPRRRWPASPDRGCRCRRRARPYRAPAARWSPAAAAAASAARERRGASPAK